ncbi:hypothetical protein BGX26_004565, partial [Mortierella sp. AD094]
MVEIKKLVKMNVLYTRLITRLSSERLSPEVFQHLMDAKAYARTPPENSKTVENVYLEIIRKDEKELSRGQKTTHISLEVQKVFNVLLLGETQSGKSTFIEYVKKYADPDYTIDLSNFGDDISSCTKEVVRSTVHTDLPVTDVVENAPRSIPTEVYLGSLINDSPNFDDFEGALNRGNFETIRTQSSESSVQYQFNLFDTPGLNDTYGKDEAHIASIYKALRDVGRIHLVLIAIGKAPFTPGFQAATKCYFDMLPEFRGLTAFVHTHVNYKDLHPGRKEVASHLTSKIELLHDMMGLDSFQHFAIDCDLNTTGPIRNCITQNIIQNILYLALFNEPVAVNRIQIYKSPKMQATDSILVEKYKSIADAMSMTQKFKDNFREAHLDKLRSEERDLVKYIKEHNTSDPVMIYESSFHEEWKVFHRSKIHYMEFSDQEHVIHKKSISCDNVKIFEEQDGEGQSYWRIELDD